MYANQSCWVKIFDDGKREYGSDTGIQEGKASWNKGRLDGIIEVILCNLSRSIVVSVPETSWYQFDRLIVPVSIGEQEPKRTHRVIQAEININHIGMYVYISNKHKFLGWVTVGKDNSQFSYDSKVLIKEEDVGKWITVSMKSSGAFNISFSSKGKM